MGVSIAHQADEAFKYLNERVPHSFKYPEIGIICGSGLGGLAGLVQPHSKWEVSYTHIPHFPQSQGRYDLFRLLTILTQASAGPCWQASVRVARTHQTANSAYAWKSTVSWSSCIAFSSNQLLSDYFIATTRVTHLGTSHSLFVSLDEWVSIP